MAVGPGRPLDDVMGAQRTVQGGGQQQVGSIVQGQGVVLDAERALDAGNVDFAESVIAQHQTQHERLRGIRVEDEMNFFLQLIHAQQRALFITDLLKNEMAVIAVGRPVDEQAMALRGVHFHNQIASTVFLLTQDFAFSGFLVYPEITVVLWGDSQRREFLIAEGQRRIGCERGGILIYGVLLAGGEPQGVPVEFGQSEGPA
ncbi:hypothetical protein DMX07_03425 [Pseudomonas soli]|uniref:Uncharacterized protein n=1 Tax=Pseudomonas soli TaxID=1306993 RepID=A0A2V4IF29_9PSED|nr:hypothetical protein DMX07_03425 [Pseudomonas soli]